MDETRVHDGVPFKSTVAGSTIDGASTRDDRDMEETQEDLWGEAPGFGRE